MLYAWGFDRVGVVAGDLYFLDPVQKEGQEGPEHGVRLEVRLLERPPLSGSVYAAQPIVIDRPVWRADLLETYDGEPGSHDRTHHHPTFRGWEPGNRRYDEDLSADPMAWLHAQLADLPGLLSGADLPPDSAGPDDAAQMAAAAPQIVATVRDLLARVRAGELGNPPADTPGEPALAGARVSWL
ncbi:MAG TPA: hypothetical protein VG435_06205 [Acidimicrobiales bacterium]|jgi:hypothetical protein|nr:hypothetical protein [Acidimicrobiales bacterium]